MTYDNMKGLVIENIKIALESIRTQKLRTALTILIIALGITALVSILTVVSALEKTLNSNFASMGANNFFIRQYEMQIRIGHGGGMGVDREKINPILSYNDSKQFKENYNFPSTSTSISFMAAANAEVKYENKKTDPDIQVYGIDENYFHNSGLELNDGRALNILDVQNNINVCVLGSDFAKGLFKDENPIDKTIILRGHRFKVVGILKEKGSTFGNNEDLRVFIPLQIARSIYSQPNINYTLSVTANNKDLLDAAVEDAMLTFRQIRKLSPVEENNFGISRSDELIKSFMSITQYLGLAAVIIGTITILGSSIALMNIMLVSVTERTREIGIRKSLGAKRSTIATQFFTETIVIGQLGGLVGILLGLGIGSLVAYSLDFEFSVPWAAMISAIIVSFIVALISGLYPALKASKLDPIEALRHE